MAARVASEVRLGRWVRVERSCLMMGDFAASDSGWGDGEGESEGAAEIGG